MRAPIIAGLLRLFAALPLDWNRRLGWLLGWILAHTPNTLRRCATINLELCLPELSAPERRRLLRANLIETGKTILEAGPMWGWSAPRIRALMGETLNAEPIDAALRAGKGVILATPHLGSWEMAGHFCGDRWELTILYRPPRLAALDSMMRHGRERCGAHAVPTDATGVRRLYETLSRGGVVGILPDQDPGQSGGVFAPFFGVSANSMVLLGRLARKTGAAVFFGYCVRIPGSAKYRLQFMPASDGIDAADPNVAAAAMNRGVEACVRACPEQYQWSYRRFRTRPPGAAKIY
ncbi:MAG: lysophospholipid acyltransferase family protein [Gammaproteobacteria bacterium]|nr:lysophospholipid acyltransferase family protein [Gammaproteobacteria bacterium]